MQNAECRIEIIHNNQNNNQQLMANGQWLKAEKFLWDF